MTHLQSPLEGSEVERLVDDALDVHGPASEEVDLVTAKGLQPHRYDEIFRLMEQGKLHPEKLVTREVDLEDINDRLEAMTSYETRGVEVITGF